MYIGSQKCPQWVFVGFCLLFVQFNFVYWIFARNIQCCHTLYAFLSLSGNSGRLTWVSPTSAHLVFSCFRNPPNSDMDWRAYVIIVMRNGGWAHRQRVSRTLHVDSEQLLQFFLVLLTGFEAQVFVGSRVRRSTNWAAQSPSVPRCLFCRLSRPCGAKRNDDGRLVTGYLRAVVCGSTAQQDHT